MRELENVAERSIALCGGSELRAGDIRLDTASRNRHVSSADNFLPPGMNLDQYEQSIIREALNRAGGNKSQAARLAARHQPECAAVSAIADGNRELSPAPRRTIFSERNLPSALRVSTISGALRTMVS